MFLATTALTEYWDTEQELLLLGPWCLPYERRSEWEGLKYQILPCPWDDRKRFYDSADYLEQVSERLLDRLAEYLNSVHKVSHSRRYWRMLVGAWVLHFLHAAYDRYVLLTEAIQRNAEFQTIGLNPQSYSTPHDTMETSMWIRGDLYNLQIFSQQLALMGYSFPVKAYNRSLAFRTAKRLGLSVLKRMARKSIYQLGQRIGQAMGTSCEVALCDMYLPWMQVAKLVLTTRFRALPLETQRNEWPFNLPDAVRDDKRNGLADLQASGLFEKLFVQLLPQNFPTLFLEGYHQARNTVLNENRKVPSMIASAVGWNINEPFKFLAAEVAEKGGHIIVIQHGGMYGSPRASPFENYELRIANRFYTWGWENKSQSTLNLPSPHLSLFLPGSARHSKRVKNTLSLYVAYTVSRYLLRFQSMPVAGQWRDYFAYLLRFVSSLSYVVRADFMFRTHPDEYWNELKPEISSKYLELQWDDRRPLYQRLKECRMVVIDHCGTAFLESLISEIPLILFWEQNRWEMRAEAEPYFQKLRDVGILHGTPEAAAAKVMEVYDNPEKWWQSNQVQEARRLFIDRYALADKNWPRIWAEALREEARFASLHSNPEQAVPQ